ncbi:MAG: extracellular solute-binding protein [Angelakisella sp.]|nr:extracellular solute-binding protein [Angelakisella sp.]
MKKFRTSKLLALVLTLALVLAVAGCGGNNGGSSTPAPAPSAGGSTPEPAPADDGALDLNALTLDQIIEGAKAEGKVESVGMPDEWADWGSLWNSVTTNYGLTHNDTDMSSSEELQMFATEGKNGTKDMGDVGYGFVGQAVSEDLVQGYKTSYWDAVPDWAKGEDGKWMVAYTGATTFLVNTDQVANVPTSWEDIRNGDYKVALGPLSGGNAQGAFIASNYAFGGDMENLQPGIDFWTEMASKGRINTLDITQANFESGEIAVGVVWSFQGIPYSKNISQYKMTAVVPSDGALQNGYASVINKFAPHPHAAALTREVMFSDEGQTYLALAGAIPTRTDFKIADEHADKVLDMSTVEKAVVITDADAYSAACETAKTRWEEEIAPLLIQ